MDSEDLAKVDHIMDHFDFSKVEKAMKSLYWAWYDDRSTPFIPKDPLLRKTAREHLKRALNSGFSSHGGFEASYGNGLLKLKFVVEVSECG